MTTKRRKHSRMDEAILETVKDMTEAGIMDEATYSNTTMRYRLEVKQNANIQNVKAEDARLK